MAAPIVRGRAMPLKIIDVERSFRKLVDEQGGIYYAMQDSAYPMAAVYNKYHLPLGPDMTLNGGFNFDANWTKHTGVTITGGKAVFSNVGVASGLIQIGSLLTVGRTYEVTLVLVNRSAGGVYVQLGATQGATRPANGTYTERITCIGTNDIRIYASATTSLEIESISIKEVDSRYSRDLAANGGFGSDALWTKPTGGSITAGVMRFTSVAAGQVFALQTGVLTIGRWYLCFFDIVAFTGGGAQFRAGNAGGGTNRTAVGAYGEIIRCGNDGNIRIAAAVGTTTLDVDNVRVYEMNMPDDSAMPVNILPDGNMEAANTNAFLPSGAALSKQTDTPFEGVRYLRVTNNGSGGGYAQIATVFTEGEIVRAWGRYRSDGQTQPVFRHNPAGGNLATGAVDSSDWQYFEVVFRIGAGGLIYLGHSNTTAVGTYCDFDDVWIVRESDGSIRKHFNLAIDGNCEKAGILHWIPGNNATVTKQTTTPYQGSQCLRVAHNGTNNPNVSIGNLILGKTYRVRYKARANSGAVRLQVNGADTIMVTAGAGTWQSFEWIFIATTSTLVTWAMQGTTSGQYGEIDDVTVEEINPLTGQQQNAIVPYQQGYRGKYAHLFNGIQSFDYPGLANSLGMYNAAINPTELTFVCLARADAAGVWADNSFRFLLNLRNTAQDSIINVVKFDQSGVNPNEMWFGYTSGGTDKSIKVRVPSTDWILWGLTLSLTSDELRAFINDQEVGKLTGLPTWALDTNIDAQYRIIGAYRTIGSYVWQGPIGAWAVLPYAVKPERLPALARELALFGR